MQQSTWLIKNTLWTWLFSTQVRIRRNHAQTTSTNNEVDQRAQPALSVPLKHWAKPQTKWHSQSNQRHLPDLFTRMTERLFSPLHQEAQVQLLYQCLHITRKMAWHWKMKPQFSVEWCKSPVRFITCYLHFWRQVQNHLCMTGGKSQKDMLYSTSWLTTLSTISKPTKPSTK